MEIPSPTTELEAVNIMLLNIGETPVNQLDGQNVGDVAAARSVLAEVNRQVQAQGWHFNRETNVPFAVNMDGKVPIPSNVARFDVENSYKDVIQRGGFAYSKTDRSYIFDATLKATVVFFLPFDELPESARYYITLRAARKFAARTVASDTTNRLSERDELEARAEFLDENEENADQTIFDNYWAFGRALSRPRRRT